ncbi:MAG: hypothetical protein A2X49_10160 [Lentisphaerae bacterium GWF2_52_8]|nr:MAG: hypothetical protein A2X49_10160 [Lentisphaerae bacterium GWF2_52_8]
MNKYYHFDDKNKAIVITRPDTPQPWINYLSNDSMHAFVSQAGGGFAWQRSAVVKRLTRYRQYNLPIDSPGFYTYIRHADGTVWSPSWRPVETSLENWSATHQPGRTSFRASLRDIESELCLFVAPDSDTLVWDMILRNTGSETETLDLFGYTELSQCNWRNEAPWGYYCQHHLETRWLPELESSIYFMRVPQSPITFFASTQPVIGFEGDRYAFTGAYRSERNPIAVERGACSDSQLASGQPCAALQHHITLKPGQTERITFLLGAVRTKEETYTVAMEQLRVTLAALRASGAIDAQRKKLEDWWNEHLSVYHCNIPHEEARRQINIWTPVNTVHTGRYSRAVNSWAPGIRGMGFRDTCQDMLAVAYRKPEWATRIFHFLLTQQYGDGHVVHYCYPEEGDPPTTSIHSDDHLWLPLLAHAIAAETGSVDFLGKEISFLAKDHKSEDGSGSTWEHLLSAVRFTESQLGSHRIPLILRSDWNDIIGKFSEKGRGESVFAAQQYVVALDCLLALAEALGKKADKDREWLSGCRERMIKAILDCAWDGNWWRRGFDDDAQPLGSTSSPFGQIWLNSQSWAVLSNIGSHEQFRSAMQAVSERLDTGVGLKKLAPGFKTWPDIEDPFAAYRPGTGENGAIFCHANTWAIMAEALLGNGERAWKYFSQLIPAVAMEKLGAERYRAEPYAWVSNIVGPESPLFGWANVEQVTGTAAWMDIAATQYLLGIRPEINGLRTDPCLLPDWDGITVERLWRGCRIAIEICNPGKVSKGVRSIRLDEKELDLSAGPLIPAGLLKGRKEAKVRIEMG